MNDSNYDANEVKQYKSVYTDNFPVLTNSSAYMTLGYRW